MIHVRMELWPIGDESRKELLGIARIGNVGGSRELGKYRYELSKKGDAGNWKKGFVEGFPRLKLGGWDLLYRCLSDAVFLRNRPAQQDLLLTQGASYWRDRALEAEAKLETLKRALVNAAATGRAMQEEPVACWQEGCYLAVDSNGRCEEHGDPPKEEGP